MRSKILICVRNIVILTKINSMSYVDSRNDGNLRAATVRVGVVNQVTVPLIKKSRGKGECGSFIGSDYFKSKMEREFGWWQGMYEEFHVARRVGAGD